MEILETQFKSLTADFDLRVDPKFYSFAISNKFNFVLSRKFPVVKLKDLIEPEYIVFKYEEDKVYNGLPTSSEYFDKDGVILKYQTVTKEDHPGRIKYEAKEGQILISSLKGAKAPVIFIKEKYEGIVVSNGFYIFRVKDNEDIIWKYVYYILKSKLMRNILDEHLSRGIGISSYKQIDLLRIKIPLPPREVQEKIVKRIEKIEKEIKEEKQKLVPLQDVIEEVFIKYGIKSSKFKKKEFEAFITDFKNIRNNPFLRVSPEYRDFWDNQKGVLFNTVRFSQIPLNRILKLFKSKIIKKGILDQPHLLISFDDIQPGTGKIINTENVVTEINSDKTLLNEADIVISKLNSHLGYVFIPCDSNYPIITSTEFIPYKVNKNFALPEYIKYLLLSKEYLNAATFLRTGKSQSHARVHYLDLLNIKIPLPSLEIQKKIVNEIQKQEKINEEAEKRVNELREEINKTIFEILKDKKEIKREVEKKIESGI